MTKQLIWSCKSLPDGRGACEPPRICSQSNASPVVSVWCDITCDWRDMEYRFKPESKQERQRPEAGAAHFGDGALAGDDLHAHQGTPILSQALDGVAWKV